MKSKNMTLMMVAIGCGLVAAFLTARLSGGSAPDTVNVLVAKKELPVGTQIDPKEIENFVGISARPKNDVPQDSILDMEQLKGKRVNRTLKMGDRFATGDVGESPEIALPAGTSKMAVRVDQISAVAGFVQPGSRVDVILTENYGTGKVRSGMFLRNMLVLAVDVFGRRPEGDGSGRTQVSSVSLAVTEKQSLSLASAEKRGKITMVLRDPDNTDDKPIPTSTIIPGFDRPDVQAETAAPAEPKVAIAVARTEIALNTQVNEKNVDELFVMKEFPVSLVSPNSIKDLKDIRSKFVTRVLDADQIVLSSSVSDNKVDPPAPMVIVKEVVKAEPKKAPKVARKKFVQTIGSTHYLFVEVGPDDFRLVGPVTDLQAITKPEDEEPVEDKKSDSKKPLEGKTDDNKPDEKKTDENKQPEEKNGPPANPDAKPLQGKPGERVTRQ